MASSSDWLTELLEPTQDNAAGDASKSLSWLHDFGHTDDAGFVGGLPFDRPAPAPEPTQAGSLPDASSEMIGDELVDILREALGESEQANPGRTQPDEKAETGSEAEPQSEPVPDPIAEAFARGEAAGRLAAKAEQKREAARKLDLRQSLRALDQAAMDALAGELAETVIALCSQSLADFIPAPDALKARCLSAAQQLGSGAGNATLHLHPDDLLLMDKEGLGDWKIVGDPLTERGGLRFETEDGSVSDAPPDWRRAIAAAIRGQGAG